MRSEATKASGWYLGVGGAAGMLEGLPGFYWYHFGRGNR